jgi:large subunit ribosomal protein L30
MGASKKKSLRVTLVRSLHGRLAAHRACAQGLGLRRMHHTVVVEDSPCTRGMINKIAYMVKCEEVR